MAIGDEILKMFASIIQNGFFQDVASAGNVSLYMHVPDAHLNIVMAKHVSGRTWEFSS